MARVVGLAVHPMRAAGTRLRLGPVLRTLEASGHTAALSTFLSDGDLADWLAGGRARVGAGLRGTLRVSTMARDLAVSDLVLLHREALPVRSLLLEHRIARKQIPMIWDVDDAVWAHSTRARSTLRGPPSKYRWLATHATEVWAGSRHVANWAEQAGASDVIWVPTTVPVPATVTDHEREDDLLVWVGTPSTGPFIETLLHRVGVLRGWRVLVVGARINAPSDLRIAQMPWTPEAELTALHRGAVGLYPLDLAHPTTHGKSGLKAVLYMAHGIPVIATPTPSNRDLMTDGEQAIFALTTDDWCEALAALRDPQLRREMGTRGHAHAAANFDSDVWAKRLAARVVVRLEDR